MEQKEHWPQKLSIPPLQKEWSLSLVNSSPRKSHSREMCSVSGILWWFRGHKVSWMSEGGSTRGGGTAWLQRHLLKAAQTPCSTPVAGDALEDLPSRLHTVRAVLFSGKREADLNAPTGPGLSSVTLWTYIVSPSGKPRATLTVLLDSEFEWGHLVGYRDARELLFCEMQTFSPEPGWISLWGPELSTVLLQRESRKTCAYTVSLMLSLIWSQALILLPNSRWHVCHQPQFSVSFILMSKASWLVVLPRPSTSFLVLLFVAFVVLVMVVGLCCCCFILGGYFFLTLFYFYVQNLCGYVGV